jgi:hypothetical protein
MSPQFHPFMKEAVVCAATVTGPAADSIVTPAHPATVTRLVVDVRETAWTPVTAALVKTVTPTLEALDFSVTSVVPAIEAVMATHHCSRPNG